MIQNEMICHLKQDVTGLFGTVTWNFVSDSQSSLCVRGESDLEILPTTSYKPLKIYEKWTQLKISK